MLTLNDGRSELWQWDTGRKMTVDADCSQVHFSNKVFGRSIDVDVVDGVAIIPDILLQTDKELTAWAFVGTSENGYTKISKTFKVNRRNKPADYVFTPTEQTTLDEIMEKLGRIEESQDPDAIKNAVYEYLANNPIQIEEEDPTVPDWAKQPAKPKYTAQEVKAVATVNGNAPDENGNVEIEITEASKPDMTGYATERYVQENYQPKGNYLTEHQKIKTINGQSIVGTGNIQIDSEATTSASNNVRAVNHRGFSKTAPENTIPAYILSKQEGFDCVECDVSFTSDNVAVLLHDATIDRTSNGSGTLSEMTYDEVRQYDFGSWKSSKYAGVKIPSLAEFLIYCKGLGLHPYIELKTNGGYTQEQVNSIIDLVERNGMKGKVTYISFSNTFLTYIRDCDPEARLGLLSNNITTLIVNQALSLKTDDNEVFLDVKSEAITEDKVQMCIDNGFPLEIWTVNNQSVIENMDSYITGVTSDFLIAGKVLYNKYSNYEVPKVEISTTGIALNVTTLEFTDSANKTLVATVTPSNSTEEVIWSSNNESVATVYNGIVTPKGNGTCIITATSGYYSATCEVTVNVEEIVVYSITNNLKNVLSDNKNTSINEESTYTANLTAVDGYIIEEVVVTMGGTDVTSEVYSNGVISIHSVTGDIVIVATGVEAPASSYSITNKLTNVSTDNATTIVAAKESYVAKLTVHDGYSMSKVVVTMGGIDVTESVYSNGTINIAEVTGSVVITAVASIDGMTMLHNWDFTQSLVDSVEGVEAKTNATINSDGVTLSGDGKYIDLTPNGSQYYRNKIFDIDIPYFNVTSTPTHIRVFGIGNNNAAPTNTATNACVFIWRYNNVQGWTWYAGAWGDTQLSKTDYPLNVFSGKTVRLEFDSDGYVTLSYADIGSGDFTEITKFTKPCTYEKGYWIIGSSVNSAISSCVFSGVRVYQKNT